uniref:Odorant receptor n=1 Tax=Protaetia brevitarsis TaxID=348688 RepID=A0A411HR60_PROBE|nr:odorant receptor [Protaetia brevitarsis]
MDVLVLVCQYYCVALIAFIVLGYDFLYLSLCIELVVQVKLLKSKLKEVFTETSDDTAFNVGKCVSQHNFLLLMHDKMQKMNSNVLLFHYFISLVTLCFDIYQSSVEDAELSYEIARFVSVAGIIGQFAFYCIPAELLSSEFMDIARALYSSKWYENKPNVQKLMIPIMVKCQRPHYFSASGLLDINMDAFGSVIRKAFSFCAVIRNVLDK